MTRRCSFTSHSCMAVRDGAGHRQEVGDLLALEPDALGVGGDKDVEGFQPGVLDLILQVGGDLHQGLVDGGMLQAGDLDPRVHLLDAQRQAPGRLNDAEGQHALLPDARLLRVQLRDAVAGDDLEAHALLRHQQEGALLFAGLAQDQLRDRPGVGGLDARPGQADGELLLAFGLAAQVQRDHAPGVGLQLGPMTQRRAADGLDVEARGHDEAQAENAGAGDIDGGIGGEDGAVFAEREGVLRLDPHVRLDGGGLQGQRWPSCRHNGRRGAR